MPLIFAYTSEKSLCGADPRAAELEDARRRMRERKIGVERFSYKPKITKKVPDYHTKQREFADKLKMRKEELKAQVEATAAKPFNIHESEPNLDRVHHDIMRDNSLLPENRWPYINSRLKGHAEPPPKMDPPKKTVRVLLSPPPTPPRNAHYESTHPGGLQRVSHLSLVLRLMLRALLCGLPVEADARVHGSRDRGEKEAAGADGRGSFAAERGKGAAGETRRDESHGQPCSQGLRKGEEHT